MPKTLDRRCINVLQMVCVWWEEALTDVFVVRLQIMGRKDEIIRKDEMHPKEGSGNHYRYCVATYFINKHPFIISSPWIWKGVSATLQSGRYTLSYPRVHPVIIMIMERANYHIIKGILKLAGSLISRKCSQLSDPVFGHCLAFLVEIATIIGNDICYKQA